MYIKCGARKLSRHLNLIDFPADVCSPTSNIKSTVLCFAIPQRGSSGCNKQQQISPLRAKTRHKSRSQYGCVEWNALKEKQKLSQLPSIKPGRKGGYCVGVVWNFIPNARLFSDNERHVAYRRFPRKWLNINRILWQQCHPRIHRKFSSSISISLRYQIVTESLFDES